MRESSLVYPGIAVFAFVSAMASFSCSSGEADSSDSGFQDAADSTQGGDDVSPADIHDDDGQLQPDLGTDGGSDDDVADTVDVPDAQGPDETPPGIRFSDPLDGQNVSGEEIPLQVIVEDDRGVARVSFYVDGVELTVDTSPPFEGVWATAGFISGPYVLTAIAEDAAGNVGEAEAGVWLSGECNADGDCPPTSVRVITPVDGSQVCGQLTIEAAASDDIGVDRIEFYIDELPLGVAQESPFRFDWNTTREPDGWYTIRATAYDTSNQPAFAAVRVEVRNDGEDCDNLPNVRISAPEDGAYVRGSVPVSANASDDEGVVGVKFFINNGLITDDTAIPYNFAWDTTEFAEGVYTIKARATDLGGQAAEAQVSVTIDRTPPTVTITSPDGGMFENTVPLTAAASDNFVVRRLEWYLDDGTFDIEISESGEVVYVEGTPVQVLTARPFSAEFDARAIASGSWTIAVVAYDGAGLAASDTASFRLDRSPVVAFESPAEGATISGPTLVRVNVTDDGSSSNVALSVDGNDIGVSTVSGSGTATFNWTPEYRARTSSLRVTVQDSAGLSATATRNVIVDHSLEVSAELCRTSCEPLNNGVVVQDTVLVRATTRDDDGSTTRVEFFVGGALQSVDTTAPFEWSWSTTTAGDGNRTLRMVATSSNGSTAELVRSVRVNNCDRDGDTYVATSCGGPDCDDTSSLIAPGATDSAGDSVDQNCDGTDGLDADGDGFANRASGGDDCNDADASVYPGAPDRVGDRIDQNCDRIDGVDNDLDGEASVASGGEDCDDEDDTINTFAFDAPLDGVDSSCDGSDGIDRDRDGVDLYCGTARSLSATYGGASVVWLNSWSGPSVVVRDTGAAEFVPISASVRVDITFDSIEAIGSELSVTLEDSDRRIVDELTVNISALRVNRTFTLVASRALSASEVTVQLRTDPPVEAGDVIGADLRATVSSFLVDVTALSRGDAQCDCDDENDDVYPGAPDTVGDTIDQNCDALDGVDADGDGVASRASGGTDCNDANAEVTSNECGGCEPLGGTVGQACAGCGQLVCDPAGGLSCEELLACNGETCSEDADCASGSCAVGVCESNVQPGLAVSLGCVWALNDAGVVAGWTLRGESSELCPPPEGVFTRIAAGGYPFGFSYLPDYACGIREGGSLHCWQSSDGWSPPTPADASIEWSRLYAGAFSLCAIAESGDVGCWGSEPGDLGQLPVYDGPAARAVIMDQGEDPSEGGVNVVSDETGQLFSSGYYSEGWLPTGVFLPDYSPDANASGCYVREGVARCFRGSSMVSIDFGGAVASVAAGCALTVEGTLICQAGPGTVAPLGSDTFQFLASGGNTVCAYAEGAPPVCFRSTVECTCDNVVGRCEATLVGTRFRSAEACTCDLDCFPQLQCQADEFCDETCGQSSSVFQWDPDCDASE